MTIKEAEFEAINAAKKAEKQERKVRRSRAMFWVQTLFTFTMLLCCTAMEIWADGAGWVWILLFLVLINNFES